MRIGREWEVPSDRQGACALVIELVLVQVEVQALLAQTCHQLGLILDIGQVNSPAYTSLKAFWQEEEAQSAVR